MAKITTTLYGDLALLPYEAETPVKESLEFLTDIIEAYDSNEQRLPLRTMPRQSFVYTIPQQLWNIAEAFNTEYGALRKKWAIPIWTEGQYVGTIAADTITINCNTELYDFRPQSLAMLFNGCGKYQIIEIDEVNETNITLISGTILISAAWLMPVRIGWINGSINKSINGNNGKSNINFVVDDNYLIPPIEAPEQYLDTDIYYDIPLLSNSSIPTILQQDQDIFDAMLGKVVHRTNWLIPRFGKPWRAILENREEIKQFKQFISRRMGKFLEFWFPSFEVNMRVANTELITTTLLIKSDSYINYAIARSHVAIEADGVWYARSVSAPFQLNSQTVQLTLSAAINVDPAKISRISYLGLYRFDTDKIDLEWKGNTVVEANIQILELMP